MISSNDFCATEKSSFFEGSGDSLIISAYPGTALTAYFSCSTEVAFNSEVLASG
jgi:hypothetical protein